MSRSVPVRATEAGRSSSRIVPVPRGMSRIGPEELRISTKNCSSPSTRVSPKTVTGMLSTVWLGWNVSVPETCV